MQDHDGKIRPAELDLDLASLRGHQANSIQTLEECLAKDPRISMTRYHVSMWSGDKQRLYAYKHCNVD